MKTILGSFVHMAVALVMAVSLQAQTPPSPSSTVAVPTGFEAMPILSASTILQPQYLQGPNFTVRNPVPTHSGLNHYTIDSDYGVFEADGNQMLMRRIAEINGTAKLYAMSQTREFTAAAKQAAETPLNVANDLVTDPVSTISSVPRGIWGFLNQAGQAVKEAAQGQQSTATQGNVVQNISGFSKTKRDLALKLGVDPYCNNEVFQKELNTVAWPAFLGKFSVDVGMAALTGGAGAALSAANWDQNFADMLRDKSPTELRLMNLGILQNSMGVATPDANAFLYNSAISPTTQTLIVAALAKLGNIPGQAAFIRAATNCTDEQQALSYQLSVQLMAKLNANSPVSRITQLNGLPVCQTNDGTVVVPIQWDYAAWTPQTGQFITALRAKKFTPPATAYTIMITGIASPMATEALAGQKVNLMTRMLPGPLL